MVDLSLFTLSEDKKKEICAPLTAKQAERVRTWIALQETLNRGDFDAMDGFFDPDFTYGNPNRPDLGTYKRFPPSAYRTISATARSDDEIWVYCHHYGKQTGGNYMGVPPKGQEINVQWFSTITFKGDRILRIFSIADVLGMMIAVGVIDPSKMPVDPYK
jgi:hypothetical protein